MSSQNAGANQIWEDLRVVISRFVQNARTDLDLRWSALPNKLEHRELYEVTGGLVSRQVTLATQLASSPNSWNRHSAPLYLRAMADAYISLAWILKEPSTRAHAFVLYGLGEEKLKLEHRKAELEKTDGVDSNSQEFIRAMEAWIEEQRVLHLVEVNLGSWSSLSTRKMAEEAGCLDFYNYVYAPFSSCVHSTWGHVGRHDLQECRNPLHQFHRVPRSRNLDPDIDYLFLCGKYLHKSLTLIDEEFKLVIDKPTAFRLLDADIDALAGETSTDEEPRGTEL